jgi:hypothetical protein
MKDVKQVMGEIEKLLVDNNLSMRVVQSIEIYRIKKKEDENNKEDKTNNS